MVQPAGDKPRCIRCKKPTDKPGQCAECYEEWVFALKIKQRSVDSPERAIRIDQYAARAALNKPLFEHA